MTALATPIDPDIARHERHLTLLERVKTGAWLDEQHFAPLAWAVPDIVPEGFGLLVGPPKLGKSWLALGLGLAVALGGRALGRVHVGDARPVLYLALEDGDRRLQDRCRKLLDGQPIPENLHYVTKATAGDVMELLDAWLDVHGQDNPLVMLDTLGRVMPPALAGESSYMRDYRVGTHLKNKVDAYPGATLLVVHHTRKAAGEDWMDSTSGTQGLNGSADFTIALTRARSETDAILKVTGRDVRENEYAMTAVEGSWTLQGDLHEASDLARTARTTAGLGDESARVVEYINAHPEGSRAGDIAIVLGLSPANVRQQLVRAEEAGRIRKVSRGLYGPVTSVTSVTNGGPSQDGRDTRDGCDTTPTCTGCGHPMADLGDGATTHPGCDR
ncbi:AAA family ATPase [Georgenia phoenicis]|uniref:AAA family ATPase n=1 Tax=unclassified Georgenia TaxID=2626815 RepID=UPI0039AF88AD